MATSSPLCHCCGVTYWMPRTVPGSSVERKYSRRRSPPLRLIYVLAHIIAGLGSLGDKHGLVFKGGTALRLCYFEDYRYSADLDFSVVEGDLNAAYKTVEAALAAVSGAVDALALTDEEPRRITYKGPLNRQRDLKLDIAVDELVLNVDSMGLLSRWPDLPEINGIPAMAA